MIASALRTPPAASTSVKPDPSCPVCGSGRFRRIAPVRTTYRRAVLGAAWDAGEEYSVCSCEGCGHLAIRPVPSPEFLDLFYRSYMDAASRGFYRAHFEDEREDGPHVVRARARATALARRSRGGRLLDVGCGPGVFLRVARQAGFEVFGVEPHAETADMAHRRTGARMCVAPIERADWEDASLDVVTMWDVLEHLRDPRDAVARASRWVRPGGWLGLETPDAGSLLHRLARASFRATGGRVTKPMSIYDVHHLHYFDGKGLRRLLAEHGFTVDGVWRESTALDQYADPPYGRGVQLGLKGVFLLADLLGWQNKQIVIARRR